ncbi:tetratricopeptide repeat protein [Larkinella soli]|uniref:tetratricopeptide repeat protein n=1 Tax=Larkinella soli TaxID=1770527 RepID=UPI000FFB6611|nr:hypothetical protein [Larkinella soli]
MKKFFLLLWLLPPAASAQLIDDTATQQLILKATDKIYNYEFDEIDPIVRQVRAKYPNHPVLPVLKSLQLYWQYLPIKENRTAMNQYMNYLNQGVALSDKILEKNENDPEGVFFSMASHGYLAMKYHYDNENMKAVNEARKAYSYLKAGFKLMEKNPEFYFTTGLYNYYVERYPMDHPIVKPVMIFFQDGDMPLGLKQMEIGAKRGIFTRTETGLYLGQIYLKHESQFARGAALFRQLADKYPQNPVFNMHCAEGLVLAGRGSEALPYIARLKEMPQKFLALPVKVLEAMIQEKAGDLREAAENYQAAIRLPVNDVFTKEFSAHAYAGLARQAARSGNRNQAKTYYKKVLDLAEYKSTIREARNFLKS